MTDLGDSGAPEREARWSVEQCGTLYYVMHPRLLPPPDGKPLGAFTKKEAQRRCDELNAEGFARPQQPTGTPSFGSAENDVLAAIESEVRKSLRDAPVSAKERNGRVREIMAVARKALGRQSPPAAPSERRHGKYIDYDRNNILDTPVTLPHIVSSFLDLSTGLFGDEPSEPSDGGYAT